MTRDAIHITEELAVHLFDVARRREPNEVSILLYTVDAGELALISPELSDDEPVFIGFYPPDIGQSVNDVFGVDLGVPNGASDGRFVSHPNGDRTVKMRDDLHSVIFVGVPPWDDVENSLAAYTRRGERLDVRFVEIDDEKTEVDDWA